MKLSQVRHALGLECITQTPVDSEQLEVSRGYASDMLSDILGNAPEGALVITTLAHLNLIAVASHAQLAALIITNGANPSPEVVQRATLENIPIYRSVHDTFTVVGNLHDLGIRGGRR